jgi:NADH:ubiquinone oxidoreductase subunit 6 (subunit J)
MNSFSLEITAFYIFSLIAIATALFILFSRNLIYAVFALFMTFLGVAALYVLAGADFLGVAQIMVYVGGVLVLLIFGVMLTRKSEKQVTSSSANQVLVLMSRAFWGTLAGTAVFGFLSYIIYISSFRMSGPINLSRSTVRTIGVEMMTSHLLPFEIIAILLLVALIGAAYLALNRNPAR